MLQSTGEFLVDFSRRWVPDPFVFAIGLTLLTAAAALALTPSTPTDVLEAWYRGFWMLLEFGMQMVLMLSTGYAIALSPVAGRLVDRLARRVNTPVKVYALTVAVGGVLALVSWGWMTLTAVLARSLAERVKGLDYPYLIACVYLSGGSWVAGLSSSIPLLLNTDANFLIEQGILDRVIPVTNTLGSALSLAYLACYFAVFPALMVLLRPRTGRTQGIGDLLVEGEAAGAPRSESEQLSQVSTAPSDRLNHSVLLTTAVSICGLAYAVRHFVHRGFDIDLNIMVFIFIMVGLLLHRTPAGYVAAMRQACGNVSGIIFQYPFYAGIMGIMMFTGMGDLAASWMASQATLASLPVIAQATGAAVNFAIPSAGGEWAVIGPGFVETAKTLCAGLPPEEFTRYVSRIALAVAYGETQTNLLQPFFLLIVLPVMGAGVRVQARDVMGYLPLPFLVFFTLGAVLLTWMPM